MSPIAFISYSHHDREFVRWLSEQLARRGIDVLTDEKMIGVGDSITQKIEEALAETDFVCFVLSQNSVSRPWVQREYRAALSLQLSSANAKPRILPLLFQNSELPVFLRDIRFADFRHNHIAGLEDLARALGIESRLAPFLDLLDLLPQPYSSCEAEFHGAEDSVLENVDVNTSSAIWQALKAGAFQLAEELKSITAPRLLAPAEGKFQVTLTNADSGLVALPEITMKEFFLPAAAPGYSYRISLAGAERLVAALTRYRAHVASRQVYLVPQRVAWSGEWKGDAEGEIDFRAVLARAKSINRGKAR